VQYTKGFVLFILTNLRPRDASPTHDKMKRVTINIGMGNNPYEKMQNELADYFRVKHGASTKYAVGKWEGADEPTLVAVFHTDRNDVREFIEKLCGWTTQTAIAVKVDGVGDLVYNEGHEGERYEFSDEYFIEWEGGDQ